MSTQLPSSPDELDDVLAALPLGRAASPRSGHIDDGELVAHRTSGLSAERAAAVDAHLAECRDCRELLAGLAEPAPALPIPLTPRRSPRWAVVAPVLAAAAAIMLYLAPTAAPPAPEYTVRSVRALTEVRGAASASASVKVDDGTRFVAIVEPKVELEGAAPAVRVLVARAGGVLERVPERAVTLGTSGVVKIEAPSSELFGHGAGRYELHVAIAREAAALAGLEGKTLGAARAPGLGWLTIDVERIDADVKGE